MVYALLADLGPKAAGHITERTFVLLTPTLLTPRIELLQVLPGQCRIGRLFGHRLTFTYALSDGNISNS